MTDPGGPCLAHWNRKAGGIAMSFWNTLHSTLKYGLVLAITVLTTIGCSEPLPQSLQNSSGVTGSSGTTGTTGTTGSTGVPISPVIINSQPSPKTIMVGQNLGAGGICVSATGNLLDFQWLKNDVIVSGQISACLFLTNAQVSDSGNYKVRIISNGDASTTVYSAAAALTVQVPAPTVEPPVITSNPPNKTLTVGMNLSDFCVVATGTNLIYQWYKNGAVLSGATAACYSKSNVQTSDAGPYYVKVTAVNGTATSAKDSGVATVTVNTPTVPPATITSDLTSKTLTEGNGLSGFCVTATGTNLTYQWYKNGAAMSGYTSSCFNKSSVALSDGGSYYVLLTTSQSSATATKVSATATLTVNPMPVVCTYSRGAAAAINFGATLTETVNCSGVPAGGVVKLLGTFKKYGTSTTVNQGPFVIPLSGGAWSQATKIDDANLAGYYVRHLEVYDAAGSLRLTTVDVSVTVNPPANCTFYWSSNISFNNPRAIAIAHGAAPQPYYNCTWIDYMTDNCAQFETVNVTCNNGTVVKTPTSGTACYVDLGYESSYFVQHGALKTSCQGVDLAVQKCVNGKFGALEVWTPNGCYSGY